MIGWHRTVRISQATPKSGDLSAPALCGLFPRCLWFRRFWRFILLFIFALAWWCSRLPVTRMRLILGSLLLDQLAKIIPFVAGVKAEALRNFTPSLASCVTRQQGINRLP